MRFAVAVLSRETKPGDDPAYPSVNARRRYPLPPPVPSALRLAARVERRTVEGFDVFTLRPRFAPSKWHILYLHGGSYVEELLREHWEIVLNLVRVSGATITVPCYPLAPEHTHEVGNAFVERRYQEVLAQAPADRVVLMGDSAGGGMCLAQAMRYRDAGLPPPSRLILFAPWCDVRMEHPDIPALEPTDHVQSARSARIAGRWWAGPDDVAHPHVSPLLGDVTGLPPVDLYLGSADLLAPDIRLMAAKLAATGVPSSMVEYPGAIHVHVAVTFTPEARDTYRRVAATLGTTPRRAGLPTQLVSSPPAALTRQLVSRLRHRPVSNAELVPERDDQR